jgi:CDP-diacylglycerol--glycerol-3-phosphate 3-phosphatidyltransferase
MIPVMVVCYYWWPADNAHFVAAFVFTLACITDWFDGYLARKLDQSTPLGAFLDPVADKLIVAVALVLLVEDFASIWLTIPATIIVGREIVISALREWMAELGKRASVAVSMVGKVKTLLQMSSIGLLLAFSQDTWMGILGLYSLYGAAILTIWSMVVYLKAAWPQLKEQ